MLKRPVPPSTVFTPRTVTLADGVAFTVRAMRPADAAIEQAFVRSLSPRSKRLRFFANLIELPPKLLYRFTHPRYPDNWALIATVDSDGAEQEIGVARYLAGDNSGAAEFAVTVADQWQGRGIATVLLQALIEVARRAGLQRLEGIVLRENQPMRRLAQKLGFYIDTGGSDDPAIIKVVKDLSPPDRGAS